MTKKYMVAVDIVRVRSANFSTCYFETEEEAIKYAKNEICIIKDIFDKDNEENKDSFPLYTEFRVYVALVDEDEMDLYGWDTDMKIIHDYTYKNPLYEEID